MLNMYIFHFLNGMLLQDEGDCGSPQTPFSLLSVTCHNFLGKMIEWFPFSMVLNSE